MNVKTRVLGMVLVMVVLAACSPNPKAISTGADNSAGAVSAAPGRIPVALTEFTIEPATIETPADQPVMLDISNDGTVPHSLVVSVDSKDVSSAEIPAGGTGTLELPALAKGSYEVWCGVPGHKEAGMTATLMAGAGGGQTTAAAGMDHGSMTPQEMVDSHAKGVEDFVANITDPITDGLGGQPLKPTMEKGVKVFDLTIDKVQWEMAPGITKEVWAYNGTVPGPEIRVHDGDRVRFNVTNNVDQPTTVHFHGMTVPNSQDGVPFVTQDPIMPGESYVYEFTVHNSPGMYLYHSHFNSDEQVQHGMFGSVIVEPRGKVDYDAEATMALSDGYLGYALNGKSFPATSAIVAKQGQTVLVHLANVGSIIHPMHLHGFDFEVIAQDGQPLDSPYMANTLMVAPGNTYEVLIHATRAGIWAYHCHILSHVEGPAGMFGMVTALVVK